MDDARVVFESCGFAAPVALKSHKSPGPQGRTFPLILGRVRDRRAVF